jgi:trimeric autotransporter adhesin
VSDQRNEFVLGTANHTYTAPGITSDLSRERQSGPLEVVTSDSQGHLASDGGLLFNKLGEYGAGIAIAMSLENPDLVANERFGIAANLGFFDGNVALGVSMMGVLGHDFAGYGERWALSGGVGVTLDSGSYGGHDSNNTVAGRAGVQVSW